MSFLSSPENLRESQRLEFKEARGGLPRDLWETYSAFANTEGGEIVLGVAETKGGKFVVVGVADAAALVSEFWSVVRNPQRVSRDIMLFDGVQVVALDGCEVVVIRVPKATRGEKPVSVYDRGTRGFAAFVRRGEGDFRATEADLQLMGYDSTPSADREVLEGFGPDALCQTTINRYRAIFSSLKPGSPWVGEPVDDFLYHVGALGRGHDGILHPTVAGLLAFGHEYEITNWSPSYLLDYREETSGRLRWDDRVVSQSGDWSGNLVDFYLTVAERVRRFLKVPFSTDQTGMVHTSRSAVAEAANEAVVNGLIHAFYGAGATVRVVVGPSSLEVVNSGTLLVEREVAIAGGTSEPRNPTLQRMFGFIGASDRAGSGLCSMWDTWRVTFGVEPELVEDHGTSSVRVVLPLGGAGVAGGGIAVSNRLERAHEGETLALLAGNAAGLTSSEVAERLGLSSRSAQKVLRALYDEGLVSRRRDGRALRYTLA